MKNNYVLAITHFGNHALHHLFPTVDHADLPKFNEDFLATCKEFNIEIMETTWIGAMTGYLKQLARLGTNKKEK